MKMYGWCFEHEKAPTGCGMDPRGKEETIK